MLNLDHESLFRLVEVSRSSNAYLRVPIIDGVTTPTMLECDVAPR